MNKENKTYIILLDKFTLPENASRQDKIDASKEYTNKQRDKLVKNLSDMGLLNEPIAIKVAGATQILVIQCSEDVINAIEKMDFVNKVAADQVVHAISPVKKRPNSLPKKKNNFKL